MKTIGPVIIGLFVLILLIVDPWTVAVATTQTSVRAWAIVDFRRTPETEWTALLEDGDPFKKETERWTRRNCYTRTQKPNAAIVSIYLVQIVPRSSRDTVQSWEALARIFAAGDPDLVLLEQYIHDCYSHVDIYRIIGEQHK